MSEYDDPQEPTQEELDEHDAARAVRSAPTVRIEGLSADAVAHIVRTAISENYGFQKLGDALGPLAYMGQCPCGAQHVSRNARVLVQGSVIYCEQCAGSIERADASVDELREVLS